MAFVFRSERKLDYQKDPQDSSQIDKNKISNINSDMINKLKNINIKKIEKENSIYKSNAPFSSNSEKVTLKVKEETPGPGAYNINKLIYDRHREFSSKEGFSEINELDPFNLPSIRLKEKVNENPGPGQYYPCEKDLFGGKFKKIYNVKLNNKVRNLSKSAKDILIQRKNKINMNNNINKFDDLKNLFFISSSKTNREAGENKNGKNNISAIVGGKDSFNVKNNESEILVRNKMYKNSISGATVETQRSSLNSSNISLTNYRNASSRILIPKLNNSEIMKCFHSKNTNNKIDNESNMRKNFLLRTIDKDEGTNNISQVMQFKYDKSKIIKSSQDHERIMLMNESKINFSEKFKEFLLDQELFSQNPGPGYYNPIEPQNQNYFYKKTITNTGFGYNTKKKILKKISPGPGEYKIDNNSIENKLEAKNNINKKGNNVLFDVKKIAKLRLAKEKESSERNKKIQLMNLISRHIEIIYDNNAKEISDEQNLINVKKRKKTNVLFNFGSNDKRFKIPKQRIPGVGDYDINNYKSIEEKNSNIVENPSYEELLKKVENKDNLLERAPLSKDIINFPSPCEYDPDIVSSIKYNFETKNLIKNQAQNKMAGLINNIEEQTLRRAKEIKEKEKQLINFLGPGKYFNMLHKTFFSNKNKEQKIVRPPFGSSENKFENSKHAIYPGPGQYDLSSYYNWVTRTYNVLFY